MAGKVCDKCNEPYKGFGTTCPPCRKGKKAGTTKACDKCGHFFTGFGTSCHECSGPSVDRCVGCGKIAYAMERIQIEGLTFHPSCFKCAHCGGKLSVGKFSKSPDDKFYCKVHFEQLFKLRGRYSLGGSSRPTPKADEDRDPPIAPPAGSDGAPPHRPPQGAATAVGNGVAGHIASKDWDGDGVPLEESNCAGIGSDEDKALRKSAAQTEPAWEGVGLEPGLWVWRVENFGVVLSPKSQHGTFHSGDSYIVLHVTLEENSLDRQIYFWLGESTSIDERGVAAYKTVELDDYFDGTCGQNREVQHRESEEFQLIFPEGLEYLAGGVASGFNPAQPEVYMTKLLQVRQTKKEGVVMKEVPLSIGSMNHRDCFLLDTGAKIFVWKGDSATAGLKYRCEARAQLLAGERDGSAQVTHDIGEEFWALVGDGSIIAADQMTDEEAAPDFGDGILYKVIADAAKIEVEEVGRRQLQRSMLDSTCVMMLDTRSEIFLWFGKESSGLSKRNALKLALDYLKTNNRPSNDVAIHLFKEGAGMKNRVWASTFAS